MTQTGRVNRQDRFLHSCLVMTISAVSFLAAPVSPALALQSSPSSLTFSAMQGSTNSPTQSLTFWKNNKQTQSWTATSTVSWLSATPGSGTISKEQDQIQVAANPSGLAAGTYSSSLMITTTGSKGNITKTAVPVTLTITSTSSSSSSTGSTSSSSPSLSLSPTSLVFSGTAGGANPSAQALTVSNTGGSTLSWTASDNVAWLTLSPPSGIDAGTVSASVNLSGLAAGSYSAAITIAATGAATRTIPVSLTISAPVSGGTITLSPTSLAFSAIVGGSNPPSNTVGLTNTGGGTLSWTISDNATWLSVSPVSGTTTTETDTLTAAVNLGGLAAGTYNGVITVTASGASNSPRTIPVTLTVSAATTGSATLTWNANTDTNLAGYKVYRATASGTYGAPVATLTKATLSYAFSGLQTGTTYFFVVTAYDTAGNESAYSNEVSKSIF